MLFIWKLFFHENFLYFNKVVFRNVVSNVKKEQKVLGKHEFFKLEFRILNFCRKMVPNFCKNKMLFRKYISFYSNFFIEYMEIVPRADVMYLSQN